MSASVPELELKGLLADIFSVPVSSIDEDSSPDTVPQWDSLSHLNLIIALEERFEVSFTDEQTIEILSYPLVKAVLAEHGVAFSPDSV